GDPEPPLRLERAVREVAVEAGADAGRADRVEDHEEDHVDPVQTPTPHHRYGGEQGDERDGHEGPEGDDDSGGLPSSGERFAFGRWGLEDGSGHGHLIASAGLLATSTEP